MNKNGFMPKGGSGIYTAATFVAISASQLFDEVPVTRLFGLICYSAAIILVIYFLWNEIDVSYEQEKRKKKKVFLILSGLSGLLFSPLMVILLAWQSASLYKQEKLICESQKNEIRQRNLKTILQYHLIGIATITVGTFLFVYSNFK